MWFAVAAGACLALVISVLALSDWDSLGSGSFNDAVVTWAVFGGVVFTTTALVGLARASTTRGSITSWRAPGLIALVAWVAWVGAFGVQWAAGGLGVASSWLAVVALFFVPTLVVFPVWAIVAAIRAKAAPDRVVVPAWTRRARPESPTEVEPAAVGAAVAHEPVPGPPTAAVAPGEVPGVPASAPARTLRRVVVAAGVVVGVLVVVAAAGVADQWMRARELSDLTALIEQSEDVMTATNTASTAAVTTAGANPTAAAQAAMNASLRSLATDGAVELGVVAADIGGVSPLPWHSAVARLRDDYLKHNQEWVRLYSECARAQDRAEMAAVYDQRHVDIATTFRVAEHAAQAALPSLFVGDVKDRLDAVFAD